MQLVGAADTGERKLLRAGIVLSIAGAVSLLASVVASGLDYVQWEKSGELYATTPSWILAWHLVSLVGIGVGIILLIVSALLRRSRKA